jgi:glucosamine 6-phosphate synthetase-like amidotransferase/phosphosugar isomerase protein
MCGIVAYIGPKNAYPILIKGLKRLEYRGYDSAGVALLNGSLQILKKEGKVSDLENFVAGTKYRWYCRYRTYKMGHSWRTLRPKCTSTFI